ncbi:MAG TPA: YceI family protein [Candidatus Solibacter sp.]|nr:YceI family protein [Candidatus Solibacter sp.]
MIQRFCLAILTLALPVHAAPRTIDTKTSTMTVHVGKSGAFSAFGHDHVIAAPIASGSADTEAHRVQLRVEAAALRVRDPKGPDSDKAQIEKTMLGPEVLDSTRHREIVFQSTSAESAGSGTWTLHGNLTLHGETRPVTVTVREQGGHFTGSASLRQTEFGIKPVKVAGGTVKVKDEIHIEFDIRLE